MDFATKTDKFILRKISHVTIETIINEVYGMPYVP
jgi:hypothetical protein